MTVRELIEALQKFDPDRFVYITIDVDPYPVEYVEATVYEKEGNIVIGSDE